jgi:hypothetical protein
MTIRQICFFDGKVICSSGQGVQQGDPLGPLLIFLVMRHVSLGVANNFSSIGTPEMSLNTSSLDDGLFGHNCCDLALLIWLTMLSEALVTYQQASGRGGVL